MSPPLHRTGYLLPLHHVPKELWRPLLSDSEVCGLHLRLHERRTHVLSFERLRTERLLRGMRFANRVFYDGNPNVGVLLGSLDHPEDWPLTKDAVWGHTDHVYIKSRIPWHEDNDGLQQNASDREEGENVP